MLTRSSRSRLQQPPGTLHRWQLLRSQAILGRMVASQSVCRSTQLCHACLRLRQLLLSLPLRLGLSESL